MSKSGVYTITHLLTGKCYVGSAANFSARWNRHRRDLLANRHHNAHLQAAWNLYGADAFGFEVLETCLPEDCIALEQYWLNTLVAWDRKYGYNKYPTAGSPRGAKWSEDAKRGIRGRIVPQAQRDRQSARLKGVPHTDSHRAKIGAAQKRAWDSRARKTRPTNEKLRKAIKGTSMLDGHELRFNSLLEARQSGFHTGHLSASIAGREGPHKGYRWEYVGL